MVMTVWKVAQLVGGSLQSVHASEAEIRRANELEGLRVWVAPALGVGQSCDIGHNGCCEKHEFYWSLALVAMHIELPSDLQGVQLTHGDRMMSGTCASC